jgi:hypothetical protein
MTLCLVETITLDDFDFQKPIAFLHIDTEGMDAKVLLGATKSIQRQPQPPAIRFEFSPALLQSYGSCAADLTKFFQQFGYELYVQSPVQLAPYPIICLQILFDAWKTDSVGRPWMDFYALA